MNASEHLGAAMAALIDTDAEALVSCYSQEFIFEDIPSGARIVDKSQLREYYDRLFAMPAVSFTEVSFFAAGKQAAGQWTWRGKTQSGEEFAIRGASLFQLGKDGIKEELLFYDPRDAGS